MLSTLTVRLLFVNSVAVAVQFTGLVFVLYAVHRRYGRRPMLMLAVGIGLLTVGSFVLLHAPISRSSDAVRIGAVLTVEFTGLLCIALSLRGD